MRSVVLRKICLLTSIIVLGGLLSACGSTTNTDDLAKYRGMNEQEIYAGGEVALYKKRYDDAIEHFEALQANYPFGKMAEQAQRNLVYAYYADKDMISAAAAAEHYVHLYPRSKYIDYIYYMKGLANFNQDRGFLQKLARVDESERDTTTMRDSYDDFMMILRFFPKSKYAPDARQHLLYLRDILAKHELNAAKFYFVRQAYVAAANRASYLVRHYQHSALVEPALEIMVQSYRALKQDKMADDALRVLSLNYPNSKYLAKLNKQQA